MPDTNPTASSGSADPSKTAWLFALLNAALGAIVLVAPITALVDRFLPDDAFYYFVPAKYFAQTGFSTFDGIHFTNGYQPLWFLVCTAVFKFFPAGGEMPIRVLLAIQVVFSSTAVWLAVRTFARLWGVTPAIYAGAVWILLLQRIQLNGLETSLLMVLYAGLFALWTRITVNDYWPRPHQLLWLGVLCGLLFLARTDQWFLVAAMSAYLCLWARRHGRSTLAGLVAFAVPVAILAGGYLAVNLASTGHLMPVSGAAKVFHSRVARDMVLAQGGWGAFVQSQLQWLLSSASLYVLFGTVVPWVLVFAGPRDQARPKRFWPFYLGALGELSFYLVVFARPYTETSWYFTPHAFLATFAVAGLLGRPNEDGPVWRRLPVFVSAMLVVLVARWSWMEVALVFLIGGVAHFGLRTVPGALLRSWMAILMAVVLGGVVAAGLGLGLARLTGVRPLLLAPFMGLLWLLLAISIIQRALAIRNSRSPTPAPRLVPVTFAAAVAILLVLMHAGRLALAAREPAGRWNYHLYQGAMWAKHHLPRDATIWAGSAGILGYFSEHTVINTDGLINDYEFLEQYLLKRRVDEYCRKWDYTIDVYPTTWTAAEFPGGGFIDVPAQYSVAPFNDGPDTRRLTIYKMR